MGMILGAEKKKTTSLLEALKRMQVYQTMSLPEEYSRGSACTVCSMLREEGYLFTTSTKTGILTVTRLK